MGTGARSFAGTVIVVALLGACGEGTGSSPSPSPSSPSPSASPSTSPSPSPSPSPSLSAALQQALSFLQSKVDVPILLPATLPAGASLDKKRPTSIYRNGDGQAVATLRFTIGESGFLEISYGAPLLAVECEEKTHIRSTHVGDYPALLAASSSQAQVVWPATSDRPQGKYRILGSPTGPEILRLARTMEPVPGLEPEEPAPAC